MKEICRHGQPDKGKKSKNAYTDVVKRKICGMVGGKKIFSFFLGSEAFYTLGDKWVMHWGKGQGT